MTQAVTRNEDVWGDHKVPLSSCLRPDAIYRMTKEVRNEPHLQTSGLPTNWHYCPITIIINGSPDHRWWSWCLSFETYHLLVAWYTTTHDTSNRNKKQTCAAILQVGRRNYAYIQGIIGYTVQLTILLWLGSDSHFPRRMIFNRICVVSHRQWRPTHCSWVG